MSFEKVPVNEYQTVEVDSVFFLMQKTFFQSVAIQKGKEIANFGIYTTTELKVKIPAQDLFEILKIEKPFLDVDLTTRFHQYLVALNASIEKDWVISKFIFGPLCSGRVCFSNGSSKNIYRDGLHTIRLMRNRDNLPILEYNFVNDKGWTIATQLSL